MTEFKLNFDEKRKRLYLKEELAEILTKDPPSENDSSKIIGLANAETVLLYPDGTDYETILESLEVLKADLELRRKRQAKDIMNKQDGDDNNQSN